MKRWVLCALVGLVACSGDDDDTDPTPTATWSVEVGALDPAILAIAPLDGSGTDLLAVGGPLVGDAPPALYRRRTDAFEPISPPPGWTGAIWWSWSASPDDVWVVGAGGQIARGPVDALEKIETNTSAETTFYGAWGSGPNDVWIVGGAPRSINGPKGTILRWDGQTITNVTPTGTASTATDVTLFKVWGSAVDDVMIVGSQGTAIHYTGNRWVRTPTNTAVQLTTVHGVGPYEMYAVGGLNQGIVLRWDGFIWTPIGDQFTPPFSGVYAAVDGRLWVAGDGGYLAAFDGVKWTNVETEIFTQFHAVYANESETIGVGGILTLSESPRAGFIGRFGR